MMGKQRGVCAGLLPSLPIGQGSCQGRQLLQMPGQSQRGDEAAQSLALPVKMQGLIHGEAEFTPGEDSPPQ